VPESFGEGLFIDTYHGLADDCKSAEQCGRVRF